MNKHLQRDLARVERGILTLGALVEEAINKAIASLINRRPDLAREVIEGDQLIDEREVEFEEDCLKVLALHQPVATDLRFLVAVLKVNSILERMGDLASNIAKCTIDLSAAKPLEIPLDFPRMVDTVRQMVRQSLDALVKHDPGLALKIGVMDDSVDDALKQITTMLKQQVLDDPATIEQVISTLLAARSLERIADMATNIAEDVVFMVEGEIIRHGLSDLTD